MRESEGGRKREMERKRREDRIQRGRVRGTIDNIKEEGKRIVGK